MGLCGQCKYWGSQDEEDTEWNSRMVGKFIFKHCTNPNMCKDYHSSLPINSIMS
jgi:hypothetical protein